MPALVPTVLLPAPSGQAAAAAHDAAAANVQASSGGGAIQTTAPHAPVTSSTASSAGHAAPATAATQPAAAHPPTQAATAASTKGQLVTLEQLRKIMTTLAVAKATAYLAPLNQAMAEFHITTRLRKAAFLGQVAHESGELKWFHEFASGMEYDISKNPHKAKMLGNVSPGDGPRYKGRGPIQLTGRNNYIAAGKALGLDLVDHPDTAVDPGVAFRTAGWFWETHGLNPLADEGNYRLITKRINGGYNHYADRVKYYDRALAVFPA